MTSERSEYAAAAVEPTDARDLFRDLAFNEWRALCRARAAEDEAILTAAEVHHGQIKSGEFSPYIDRQCGSETRCPDARENRRVGGADGVHERGGSTEAGEVGTDAEPGDRPSKQPRPGQ